MGTTIVGSTGRDERLVPARSEYHPETNTPARDGPFIPSWEGATDTYNTGMGGVYKDLEGQWFICHSPFSWKMQARLVSDTKTRGGQQ